eukprot:364683-Chlamydomonas_euryale.AAC.7
MHVCAYEAAAECPHPAPVCCRRYAARCRAAPHLEQDFRAALVDGHARPEVHQSGALDADRALRAPPCRPCVPAGHCHGNMFVALWQMEDATRADLHDVARPAQVAGEDGGRFAGNERPAEGEGRRRRRGRLLRGCRHLCRHRCCCGRWLSCYSNLVIRCPRLQPADRRSAAGRRVPGARQRGAVARPPLPVRASGACEHPGDLRDPLWRHRLTDPTPAHAVRASPRFPKPFRYASRPYAFSLTKAFPSFSEADRIRAQHVRFLEACGMKRRQATGRAGRVMMREERVTRASPRFPPHPAANLSQPRRQAAAKTTALAPMQTIPACVINSSSTRLVGSPRGRNPQLTLH